MHGLSPNCKNNDDAIISDNANKNVKFQAENY